MMVKMWESIEQVIASCCLQTSGQTDIVPGELMLAIIDA